ncbi:MAG: ABC transporter substrate-binding protein [Acidiferrobacterales bacterium]
MAVAHCRHRIIGDSMEVVRRQLDIIIESWCGKKFRPDRVRQRRGWTEIPAVRHGHVYEIKSADILQPGPAALGDGLARLGDIA